MAPNNALKNLKKRMGKGAPTSGSGVADARATASSTPEIPAAAVAVPAKDPKRKRDPGKKDPKKGAEMTAQSEEGSKRQKSSDADEVLNLFSRGYDAPAALKRLVTPSDIEYMDTQIVQQQLEACQLRALRCAGTFHWLSLRMDELMDARQEVRGLRDKNKELEAQLKVVGTENGQLKGDLEKKVAAFAVMESDMKKADSEIASLKGSLQDAQNNVSEQLKIVGGLRAELDEAVADSQKLAQETFDNVLEQVRCLYPDADLSQCGLFKVVRDGAIVDMPDDEEAPPEADGGNQS